MLIIVDKWHSQTVETIYYLPLQVISSVFSTVNQPSVSASCNAELPVPADILAGRRLTRAEVAIGGGGAGRHLRQADVLGRSGRAGRRLVQACPANGSVVTVTLTIQVSAHSHTLLVSFLPDS